MYADTRLDIRLINDFFILLMADFLKEPSKYLSLSNYVLSLWNFAGWFVVFSILMTATEAWSYKEICAYFLQNRAAD